ncbi:MAG: hypothetical protein O8C62_01030 [Candidatus Methanoperedens sp.]|nr:hypothetical protein [Candidatus Methanoperedens sp.]
MSQINQEKIKQLKSEAEKIIELSNKFFSSITIQTENQMISNGSRIPQFEGGYRITKPNYVKSYSWGKRSTEISEMQVELLGKYDLWYEEGRFIIKTFLSDRLEAFNESYEEGRKYINLDYPPNPLGITYFFNDFRKHFNIGQNILLISSKVEAIPFVVPNRQLQKLVDMEFEDVFYNKLRDEINDAYKMGLFTSVMLLSRKLFENLLIEILRIKYPPNQSGNLEIYFIKNEQRFQNFTVLLKNIEDKKSDFTPDEHLISEIISLIKPFRKGANLNAHSIIIVSDEKGILSFDIPRISALLSKLYSNIKRSM